jgi:hypothetical protein
MSLIRVAWAWLEGANTVVGLLGFAFLVYQQAQIRALRKELRLTAEKVNRSRSGGDLVLNFSGHPMAPEESEEGWLLGKQICTISTTNRDLNHPADAARQLLAELDPAHLERLKRGEAVAVALPGSSLLATHLLVLIHGISGGFPRYTWSAERREKGRREWVKPVDLHAWRTAMRESR